MKAVIICVGILTGWAACLRHALTGGLVIRITLLGETAGWGAGIIFATPPRARRLAPFDARLSTIRYRTLVIGVKATVASVATAFIRGRHIWPNACIRQPGMLLVCIPVVAADAA